MIRIAPTSISIFIATISAIFLLSQPMHAQGGKLPEDVAAEDSTSWFEGLSVSVDLVGPLQLALSSYGQYEAALRVNMKDRFFPILELGIGRANQDEEVTQTHYETKAPYMRIGVDFNLMKNKHDIYRLYGGARYGFTSFKFDVSHPPITDPIWQGQSTFDATDVKSSYHWMEAVFGVDAKIWGPVRLGWSVRYRHRLKKKVDEMDNCWYVPGYGVDNKSNLGGTFNVIVEI